jgi:RNA polymerase sigma-70 factor (ECF subfamily)
MAKSPVNLNQTRASLLNRLKNLDDQESWRDFYDTYSNLIYQVAFKSGLTDTEAKEVLQETMIRIAKKMPDFKYDPARSFKGFLLHETGFRIKDQFGKRHPERQAPGRKPGETSRTATIDRIPDPAGSVLDDVWNAEWEKNLFDRAIKKVKGQIRDGKAQSRQYQLFDLYVIKQWPAQKVADAMGVKIGQVFLAKHRITALIKKAIKSLENCSGADESLS